MNIIRPAALALLGCIILALLGNPDIQAHSARATALLGGLWIAYSILDALLAAVREVKAMYQAITECFAAAAGLPPDRRKLFKLDSVPEPTLTLMSETTGIGARWTYIRGLDDELLEIIAHGTARGLTFAEKSYAPQLMSGPQFRFIQDEFLRLGLATWKNPTEHRQGSDFTPSTRAALDRIHARSLPHPTGPLRRLRQP
jgi:hypothetical protein